MSNQYSSLDLPLMGGGTIDVTAWQGGIMLTMEHGALSVSGHMTAMTARLLAAELLKGAGVIDPQPPLTHWKHGDTVITAAEFRRRYGGREQDAVMVGGWERCAAPKSDNSGGLP